MNTLNPLVIQKLRENWGWYLALGVVLTAGGVLSIAFAWFSTVFSVIYLGSLLFVLGVVETVKSVKLHPLSQFLLHAFLGVASAGAGLYLIVRPDISAISLTLLLAWLFIASGIAKIVFSFKTKILKPIVLVVSGILDIILGALIWYQWPLSGLWVIGTLMGINMIFTGWNWIMLAFTFKNLGDRPH